MKIYIHNDGTNDWRALQAAYTISGNNTEDHSLKIPESKCDNCQRHKLGSELLQIDEEWWCLNCLTSAIRHSKAHRIVTPLTVSVNYKEID